ncbi:MAG: hypothetical protein A3K65_06165 [Euryarchaeota archaeon RBG_16_68_12]|nr:MAG: hypothetical protein A3K65_06165 [Euryarchaeota archaeon RBG_16_68_12]
MSKRPWQAPKALFFAIATAAALMATAGVYTGVTHPSSPFLSAPQQDCGFLSHFPSSNALTAFLTPARTPSTSDGGFLFGGGTITAPATTGTTGPGSGPSSGSFSYSGTNNQVAGVDEADIVKTDGERIYAVAQGHVTILAAYPPQDAGVLSRIPTTGSVDGLFVNGDRLVVIESGLYSSDYHERYYRYYGSGPTRVLVYDIADPAAPVLARNVTVTGGYVASRMIGGHVYVVASDYAHASGGDVVLPSVTADGQRRALTYADVGYFRDSEGGGSVTTVLAVAVRGIDPPAFEAFLTRTVSQVYVSEGNVYIAGSEWSQGSWGSPSVETSTIHKLSISGGEVQYRCSVRVPGTILNQFSMDEHDGYLRVATTVGHVSRGGGDSRNNVYVVDEAFVPTGALEGLAPGEQIHSARFMGDRGYLVTFKKIDPLFVIDLSDPRAPTVLGYLKTPGYSDYLHPYDATHLIGVGKDAYDMGDFAWYQGLKVSLFDVSDVEHPTEVGTLVIGDRGTDSEVLRDHKAFLFIPERNLLVLPVELYEVDRSTYPGEVPPQTYGEFVWQGAYVLSVTLDGITLTGRVTHGMDAERYGYGVHAIRRSLYIGDVLYTVSPALVGMNSLDDLTDLGRVPT